MLTLSIVSGKQWLTEWASTTPRTDWVSEKIITATEAMAVTGVTQGPTSSLATTGKHSASTTQEEAILFRRRQELWMPQFRCASNPTRTIGWLIFDLLTRVVVSMLQELGGGIREEEVLQLQMLLLLLYQATTMLHRDVRQLHRKISQLVSTGSQAEELKRNLQKPADLSSIFLIGAFRPDLCLGITLFLKSLRL